MLGWSGDAVQLKADNPSIEFVQPEEGFPSDESLERSTDLRPLATDEEREVEDAFQRVLGA